MKHINASIIAPKNTTLMELNVYLVSLIATIAKMQLVARDALLYSI